MKNKRAILLFVDGFGLGKEEKWDYNPIETGNLPILQNLLNGCESTPIDASLGVSGIPQSATGQTTILTGINAPKAIGKHLNGFPNRELQEIIKKTNIFTKLQELDLEVINANAYNEIFLSKLLRNTKTTVEMSVSTVATLSAGISLNTEINIKNGTAVYQDLTNRIMMEKWKSKVPIRTPQEAGKILGEIVQNHNFTFFEFFQTDLAGHSQNFDKAYHVLEELDAFIGSLLETLNFVDTLFVFVSDHGNIEDLSTADHTMNKVPVIVVGNGSENYRRNIQSIQDITPKMVQYFLDK